MKPVFAALTTLFLWSTTSAQKHTPEKFFAHLLEDQRDFWTASVDGDTWNDIVPLLLVGLTGASFALDGNVSTDLRETTRLDTFNDVFTSDGTGIALAAIPLGVLAVTHLTEDLRARSYGWRATEAMVGSLAAAISIRTVSQRSRPHSGETYGFWEGGNSFPSGHSTAAWALAAVTADEFSEHKWIPWVVYPLAGLISFSRVTTGNHYISDAVAGSLLGFSFGKFLSR